MTPRELTERDERRYNALLIASVVVGAVTWMMLGITGVIVLFGIGVLLLASAVRGVGA